MRELHLIRSRFLNQGKNPLQQKNDNNRTPYHYGTPKGVTLLDANSTVLYCTVIGSMYVVKRKKSYGENARQAPKKEPFRENKRRRRKRDPTCIGGRGREKGPFRFSLLSIRGGRKTVHCNLVVAEGRKERRKCVPKYIFGVVVYITSDHVIRLLWRSSNKSYGYLVDDDDIGKRDPFGEGSLSWHQLT